MSEIVCSSPSYGRLDIGHYLLPRKSYFTIHDLIQDLLSYKHMIFLNKPTVHDCMSPFVKPHTGSHFQPIPRLKAGRLLGVGGCEFKPQLRLNRHCTAGLLVVDCLQLSKIAWP